MDRLPVPRSSALPDGLRLLVETDRRGLVQFLERSVEENVFLLSRITADGVVNEASSAHGRFYGYFGASGLEGVAFFGHRKGLVLSGEGDEFLRAATEIALGAESEWILLVAPRIPSDRFLSHYRWRGRPTHVNRIQDFYVAQEASAAAGRAPLRRAEDSDLDDVVAMSEQMLLEDFRLPPGSLSREAMRESMQQKVADGRTWVLEDRDEVVFKIDVSAQFAGGAQIEGVFTRPHRRGRGYARRGVATLTEELLKTSSFVTLHVDQENAPAKRAYEKAGFRRYSEFRLVLLRPGR
jgi:ribosomal protein S18 acetylase RimI-like enzyme